MVQAICSAGVVTTFDYSLKGFNNTMKIRPNHIKDTNGWTINCDHIISWTELAKPSSD